MIAGPETSRVETAIDRAKRLSVLEVCQHLLPDGKREGNEWVARNPTRHDETPGSFKIHLLTGMFADFAEASCRGNDVVALWAYCRRVKMSVAAQQMLDEMSGATMTSAVSVIADRPVAIMPVPPDCCHQPIAWDKHPTLGRADSIFVYRTVRGELLGYVCRWDLVGGKKEIRPRCYARRHDGSEGWAWVGPTGDQARPLFRLEALGSAQTVVLVEGEAKAIAGADLFPSTTAVLGWMGGAAAAKYVDLSPLEGRNVVLFPDHDSQADHNSQVKPYNQQPGVVAMHTLGARLLILGCKVWMVDYELGEQPDGWDLADAKRDGWTIEQTRAYVQKHKRDFAKPKSVAKEITTPKSVTRGTKALYTPIPECELPLTIGEKVVDAWQNIDYMMSIYGVSASYDMMRKEAKLTFSDGEHRTGVDELFSCCNISKIPSKNLDRHLNVISRRNSIHPAIEWINSREWDGVTRLDALVSTIHSDSDPRMVRQFVLRWMLSAIALLFRERMGPRGTLPAAHGVLTFTGVGGGGKTSWIQSLAPGDMVRTGVSLAVGNKDSEITVLSSWICELGEVESTFRKSDIQSLNAFITRSQDKIRMPYGRTFDDLPRMTVFAASVNDPEYLGDNSGAIRRWLTIAADKLDYDHDVDMQQVWAEMLSLYRAGEQWHMTAEEFAWLQKSNALHVAPDLAVQMLISELDWHSWKVESVADVPAAIRYGWSWRTPAGALVLARVGNPGIAAAKSAARWLRDRGTLEKKNGNNAMFFVPGPRGLAETAPNGGVPE